MFVLFAINYIKGKNKCERDGWQSYFDSNDGLANLNPYFLIPCREQTRGD